MVDKTAQSDPAASTASNDFPVTAGTGTDPSSSSLSASLSSWLDTVEALDPKVCVVETTSSNITQQQQSETHFQRSRHGLATVTSFSFSIFYTHTLSLSPFLSSPLRCRRHSLTASCRIVSVQTADRSQDPVAQQSSAVSSRRTRTVRLMSGSAIHKSWPA